MYEHVESNIYSNNIYLRSAGRERGARGTSRIVPEGDPTAPIMNDSQKDEP
jgi:hypothetical protein